jgi:GT2 family glycosyltransferase
MLSRASVAEQLTLIICTYGRPAAMRRLLEALPQQSVPPDEVLVVDASPDDATAAVVCGQQERWPAGSLHYFRPPPEQRGLTRQRNYGIERARSAIIAFLDDDTIPAPGYFAELRACFERHPAAIGVGGYITNEIRWRNACAGGQPRLSAFRSGTWERRDDYRWRLRKLLRLDSPLPPGWMPRSGHARPIGFLPPDDQDRRVEFVMGGASAWRSRVFRRQRFSPYFAGYGLYEDLDFCVRAACDGELYLCTRAQLEHYHAPAARPNQFRYGVMVVRNGWFVWRRRWPMPPLMDRLRWWAITLLLAVCRLGDALRTRPRGPALSEAVGRIWGMLTLLFRAPREVYGA